MQSIIKSPSHDLLHEPAVGTDLSTLLMFDQWGNRVFNLKSLTADFQGSYNTDSSKIFLLSADGRQLVFGLAYGGGNPVWFDAENRSLQPGRINNTTRTPVAVIPDGMQEFIIYQRTGTRASPHACDRLAAHSHDTDAVAPGVNYADLEASATIEACTAATREQPDVPRFKAQLGRGLYKAGRYTEALRLLQEASREGNALSMAFLGIMCRGVVWRKTSQNPCIGS